MGDDIRAILREALGGELADMVARDLPEVWFAVAQLEGHLQTYLSARVTGDKARLDVLKGNVVTATVRLAQIMEAVIRWRLQDTAKTLAATVTAIILRAIGTR